MSEKILGHKAYGSIPHLPGSRAGNDQRCNDGEARIATVKARDKHDTIIVQEKLDGSNCAVAKVGGVIRALGRAGWPSDTSPYEQHHLFARWVRSNTERFDAVLRDGERVVGEWLAQAHGTRYVLHHEPFVIFDLMHSGHSRLPFLDMLERVRPYRFVTPKTIHIGSPLSIDGAMERLGVSGHGAIDAVEGAVWRVERNGAVDFLVKYVRPDKEDGKYLPEVSGDETVWNKGLWEYMK